MPPVTTDAGTDPGASLDLRSGKLVLGDMLGHGGMAAVYLAHRTGPGGFSRKVVLKKILPEYASDATFVERFIREATIAAQFHHPNIVEILELGTTSGDYYILMEFLDGRNLRDIIVRL